MPTARQWIEWLELEPHVEGGYFRRTFQADHRATVPTPAGERFTLTSIHSLLTHWAPIGHWHLNRSDILHFHHHGDPITYHLLFPDGRLPGRGWRVPVVLVAGTAAVGSLLVAFAPGLTDPTLPPNPFGLPFLPEELRLLGTVLGLVAIIAGAVVAISSMPFWPPLAACLLPGLGRRMG